MMQMTDFCWHKAVITLSRLTYAWIAWAYTHIYKAVFQQVSADMKADYIKFNVNILSQITEFCWYTAVMTPSRKTYVQVP